MGKKHKMGAKPTQPVAMRAAPSKPVLTEDQLTRRARRALVHRDVVAASVRRFDLATLADLERRAGTSSTPLEEGPGEVLHDGHPASLRKDPAGVRGRASKRCTEDACPALAVAGHHGCEEHSNPDDEDIEDLPPPPQGDPVGEMAATEWREVDAVPGEVRAIFEELDRLARLARVVERRLGRLQRNRHAGRELSVGTCQACDVLVAGVGSDRLRAGFCNACDVAWRAEKRQWTGPGAPDRATLIRERRLRKERQPS